MSNQENNIRTEKETSISDFEHQKENILPLQGGRSAAHLSCLFGAKNSELSLKDSLTSQQQKLAAELDIPNYDDPLEPFYSYIQWMQKNFPQGHPDIMLTVEKAARNFRKDARYKNDPRFVKLWLMVVKNTKDPQEVFKYLSVNKIGESVGLFYEEYAHLMELHQRFPEAEEIYTRGIKAEAQPLDRLKHKFNEFLRRKEFYAPLQAVQSRPTSTLTTSSKIDVYRDEDSSNNRPIEVFPDDSVEWDDYGTLEKRRRENVKNVQVMAGSILLQKKTAASEKQTKQAFQVYKDSGSVKKMKETLVCDLSLVYIGDDEFSFEEIRALRLGYMLDEDDEPPVPTKPQRIPLGLKPQPLLSKVTKKLSIPVKAPLAMNSPTINTKAAMADVFDMFSKPLVDEEEDVTISSKLYKQDVQKVDIFSDFQPDKEYGRQLNRIPRVYSLMTPIKEDLDDKLFTGISSIRVGEIYDSTVGGEKSILDVDCTFANKSSLYTHAENVLGDVLASSITPVKKPHRQSTPAKANISHVSSYSDSDSDDDTVFPNPCDPRSSIIFSLLIQRILPTLKSLSTLHDSRHTPFSATLEYLTSVQLSKTIFTITSKIGSGVNATVYLISEEIDYEDIFYALKIQSTPTPWEFYILNELSCRLSTLPVHGNGESVQYIPDVHDCYVYQNACLITMQYYPHGTLLQHINANPTFSDDMLQLFWCADLLRCVERIHAIGIIHGDIKADNILIRVGDFSGYSLGKGGEGHGVVLCDWGSSIDTSLFPFSQTFQNDPTRLSLVDKQERTECYSYRSGGIWGHECDWYGIAGVMYTLLFGKYMQVDRTGEEEKIVGCFKRYWQCDIWKRVFDVLINAGMYNKRLIESGCKDEFVERDGDCDIHKVIDKFPFIMEIRKTRHMIEDYLLQSGNKGGRSLKVLLRKIEIDFLERV